MVTSLSVWDIFIELILAVYGGFVGVLFALYASGNHTGLQVWFLIFYYGIFAFAAILILSRFNKK